MLLVKTKLDRSTLHGIGLFVAELIREGKMVWRYSPEVDIKLPGELIAGLLQPCREQIRRYTYREKFTGLYVLCSDDARFFNHSTDPNCVAVDDGADGVTVARREISHGEELTCDYALFNLDLVEGKYQI